MNYLGPIGRVFGNLKGFYSGINGATLTGAIDVIVVEQEDGSFKCSPFHVRFGKLGVLRSKEKVVDIEINGAACPLRMKLGDSGEAFFVQELDSEDELDDENLATSPLPGSPRNLESAIEVRLKEENKGTLRPNNDVLISIDEDRNNASLMHSSVSTGNLETYSKSEENKRKRRKKRRRNNGSKSDIKIDLEACPPSSESEPIFSMDEDFSNINEALKAVDPDGTSQNRSYHRDFFSDTEIEATNTPPNSRPATPIQSDSEYEIHKVHINNDEDTDVGKWVWGELPSTGNTTPTTPQMPFPGAVPGQHGKKTPLRIDEHSLSSDDETKGKPANKSGVFAGVFSFMKGGNKTENSTSDSKAAGVYLDDLNVENMDPATAALYFPSYQKEAKLEKEEDVESGKGNSVPQSPAPGSSPKQSQLHLHMTDRRRNESSSSDVQSKFEAISLCGNSHGLFEQSQITYDELVENPDLLLNQPPESIVVKIDGKLVPWSAALPQLLSTTFFKRPLPQNVFQKLIEHGLKKDDSTSLETSSNLSSSSLDKEQNPKKQYSWFPWRRTQTSGSHDQSNDSILPEEFKDSELNNPAEKSLEKTPNSHIVSLTSSSDESEVGGRGVNPRLPNPISIPNDITNLEKYKKSLRLTSDQIKSLGLSYGQNEAVFSVTTAYQGTSLARCHIYLWKYDDRIVISDIDGTITKSDVLGHILPIIGNDWAQSGVAQLFTQICANGYKMLYLSARAIGQASSTREYLKSIKQGDVTLPDGPLLLNPTSLMSAFHREVIEKKPEDFKIACLRDIQTLFPKNPFYAGYGNRINDVWSYRAVDIHISRIFTINHKGELRHALTNSFQSSYTSLIELAEHIFPAYKCQKPFSEVDGFTSFEFWREPLPLIQGSPRNLRCNEDNQHVRRPRSNTVT